MEAISTLEWRNQHSCHEFPLIDSSSYIPDGIFVDIAVALYNSEKVFLNEISIDEKYISGSIKSDTGDTLSFSAEIAETSDAVVEALSTDGRSRGRIVFGHDAPKLIMSIGTKNLSLYGLVEVIQSCVISIHADQVSSVGVGNSKYRGIVNLVAGDGVQISGTGNDIIVNATGKMVFDPCCEEYATVKTIANVSPGSDGILIRPKDTGQPHTPDDIRQLIRVTNTSNGITISLSN